MTLDRAREQDVDRRSVQVTAARNGSVLIVSVRGDLDLESTPMLTAGLDRALSDNVPSAVIVDLTDVDFLSSTGMTALIDTHRRLGALVALAVVSNGPATTRPLTLVGMDEMLSLHPDLDAALAAVSS
ncbi:MULTISPECIES: STAS domain-containing protein [unclassified Rhodococcus (in: high G+C Gram-positive bacteria)]|uniref:STAS domain-containing protein n=1 Tax=unclassified Rhodococcus (in: high G+C Gram-positive bacteria) TaxID=192944 RepID=UPI001C9A6D81|nr:MULTISPECIES: STAS domain-containing protein [unclassified Rhodococcus (in: high G+C Gram-positive bacteria)]MBY6682993.1 STAS domain-containing protein [Rhodococcus sp. BP-316]MBY6685552.1 STAS domain-containing protein [Rhodococcus sp. BP-288]MBY6694883.1 STAS domain-containing protein [Rhodococcus sp. BP-188]MBY6696746.1 STAS domain-containing protein [Rhodococcus sp. BP-285]MBY6703402.1 STAS domain-containing protein [Rhodococcus sp. BP-283]